MFRFLAFSGKPARAWWIVCIVLFALIGIMPLGVVGAEDDVPDLDDAIASAYAFEGVINADWTIVEYAFDDATMVLVPVGSFLMGSDPETIDAVLDLCNQSRREGECSRNWFEREARNGENLITIATPFWIDRTEVTREAYQACVDAGVCEMPPDSDYATDADQPINRVTWFQAYTYCEWRGSRLPTEAEWEYVARGPEGWEYPWGTDFDGTEANHCDQQCGESEWGSGYRAVNMSHDDGYAVVAPVGSYPDGASWVGALDMTGNVAEWTSTIFLPYPYDSDDGRENMPDANDEQVRTVLRGGAFSMVITLNRSAYRMGVPPSFDDDMMGFRCARSVE